MSVELTVIGEDNCPVLANRPMTAIEVFNETGNTQPIANLTQCSDFTIEAIIPERQTVTNTDESTGEAIIEEVLKLILVTSEGTYHSFSKTFNKQVFRFINAFKEDIYTMKLCTSKVVINDKVSYNLQIVED